MALDDAITMQQVHDTTLFINLAQQITKELSKQDGELEIQDLTDQTLPAMLKVAFNALGTALGHNLRVNQ
jgi:hypothetical protein